MNNVNFAVFYAQRLLQKYSQIFGYDLRIYFFALHVVQDPQDGGAATFETSNYSSSDTASHSDRRSTAVRTLNLAVT